MNAFISSIPVGTAATFSSSSTTPSRQSSSSALRLHETTFMTPLRTERAKIHTFETRCMQEVDLPPMDDVGQSSEPQYEAEPESSAPPPVAEDAKLFVGNLSWNTTDSSLGAAFESFGTVIDARVIMDKFTGKSRGFGFIEYDNSDSAQKALVGMDGVEVDGRAVRVDRANRRNGGAPQRRRY